MPHRIFDEGLFAFVKARPGVSLAAEELAQHCQGIASYKRPQHFELWPEGEELPLTRVAKVDKLVLRERALRIIDELRAHGRWDAEGQAEPSGISA